MATPKQVDIENADKPLLDASSSPILDEDLGGLFDEEDQAKFLEEIEQDLANDEPERKKWYIYLAVGTIACSMVAFVTWYIVWAAKH